MSEADTGTFGFLCGLCEVIELPGPFLTRAYGDLGLSPAGTRSLLARGVRAGDLVTRRVGRCTVYRMAGNYLARFRTIQRSDEPLPWRGAFHQAIYEIPEAERQDRDALRTAAFAEGWGCPRPGVLLGFTPPGAWAARCHLGLLQVDDETASRLVAAGWPVAEHAAAVRRLAAQVRGTPDLGGDPARALRHGHRLFGQFLQMLGRQPRVPPELLPHDFPAAMLTRLFADVEAQLTPAGEAATQRLAEEVRRLGTPLQS